MNKTYTKIYQELSAHTPCYLLDIKEITEQTEFIKAHLDPSIKIIFSVKANPWVVDHIQSQVDCFEVCSIGELEWCLSKGIPAQKISAGGVCKSDEDLVKMMTCGLSSLSIESPVQWDYVKRNYTDSTEKTSLLLRLSSGNQFGLDWEQIKTICRGSTDCKIPHTKGLHFYSGTQKRNASVILAELEMLDTRMKELCHYDSNINILQYGPGIGVSYFIEDQNTSDKKIFCDIILKLNELAKHYTIRLEAGRMLCASAGRYFTKIRNFPFFTDRKDPGFWNGPLSAAVCAPPMILY